MKLVTFERDNRSHVGAIVQDLVYDVFECTDLGQKVQRYRRPTDFKPPCRMVSVLRLCRTAIDEIREGIERVRGKSAEPEPPLSFRLEEVSLLAPVPRPYKLLALAGNYAEHVREGGGEAPEKATTTPRVFMKPPSTTVTAPGAPIVIPKNGNHIDYEIELGIVMGRHARFVSAAEALDHVGGYTIINDVSERRLRVPDTRKPRDGDKWFDWLNGKWFDSFAPMGPCLTTPDEIPDPQTLHLCMKVNGEVRQNANTSQMTFTCADLIEWISSLMTLEPGDVIATGTPAGVGSATQQFLKPGDVVEAEIEKIGVLRSPVIAG